MDDNQSDGHAPSAVDGQTFASDMSIRVDQPVGSMSISPSGRDVVLASRQGLHIIDLDAPYSPPRHLPHHTPWEVADVQWSPFAVRDYWVISTSNQKALVWNLAMASPYNAIEHVLHAHTRAITDINFSAHHPDVLATCAVDSFVHCWDLRNPFKPSMTFCDWFAGATQVKWNRQDPHIIASSHDKILRIWDNRKGAYPLRSIEAHNTKIYGIDWNRTRPNSVATCSLDKSIKFWDYSRPEDEPERVIRTPFPVWRARHTPFGSGMLAMPQREDCDLHLYDRRLGEGVPKDGVVAPVHKFEGHESQVKEFLWRPRGTFVDDIDHREFQLVSWGTDRDLHLHRVEDETMRKVGHERGKSMHRGFNFTRRNAIYKTFREDTTASQGDSNSNPSNSHGFMHDQGFSSALGGALNAAMKKAPIPLSRGWADGGFMTSRTGKEAKRRTKREPTAIEWLKGVRIGKKPAHEGYMLHDGVTGARRDAAALPLRQSITWDTPENLGDEVTHVADKFTKVHFDEVNIAKRSVAISMNGPWGETGKVVHVQLNLRFPEDYPERSAPEFKMEKTSSMSEETLSRMNSELETIAASYLAVKRGCLEAVLCYLLGEADLEGSTAWLFGEEESDIPPPGAQASHSSSEDEEDSIILPPDIQAQDMESSGTEVLVASNTNANVPLPKECGAIFSPNGRLVCFFPPKQEKMTLFGSDAGTMDDERWVKSGKVFQGFGRLEGSPAPKSRLASALDEQDDDSEADFDSDSFETSSSSSKDSDRAVNEPIFSHFSSWRANVARSRRGPRALSTGYSQRSTAAGSALKDFGPPKPKNVVSLRNVDDILPASKVLAEEYVVSGEGFEVCEKNANVASRHGLQQIADVWSLAKLLLHDEHTHDDYEHLFDYGSVKHGRRSSDHLRKTDSGLDLSYDNSEAARASPLVRNFRPGSQPLGGRWLVNAIFDHFERLADIQMLGMLTFVFRQASSFNSVSVAVSNVNHNSFPTFANQASSFSPSALASNEIASHVLPSTVSIPSIAHPETSFGTYSSGDSSNGPLSTPIITSYSTSTTPPTTYKPGRASTDLTEHQPHSLSASPEHTSRRSFPNFAGGFATGLARQLSSGGSSPPGETLMKRASIDESAPSHLPSGGLTWGQKSSSRPLDRDKIPSFDAAYSDTDDEDDDYTTSKQPMLRVTPKNQSKFEGEGPAVMPLLDPKRSARFQGYLENYATLLSIWDLELRRLELLKHPGPRTPPADLHLDGPVVDLGKRRRVESTTFSSQGLHTLGLCADCGNILRRKSSRGASAGKCGHCQRTQTKVNCSLCNEAAQGVNAPCLSCGHVLHLRCYKQWFLQHERKCPTGCGCHCTTATIEKPVVTFTEEDPPSLPHHEKKLSPVVEKKEFFDGHAGWEGWEDLGSTEMGRRLTTGDAGQPRAARSSFSATSLRAVGRRGGLFAGQTGTQF